MNPGGIVIGIAGVWLACQVFKGNMLERLGVVSASSTGPSTSGAVNRSTSGGLAVMTA